MILTVHDPSAVSYDIGDDIRQVPLALAIGFEADTVAYADCDLLATPDQAHRDEQRGRIITEMTAALTQVGDTYAAPGGVRYSLVARHVEE
jgi:hypothetical protein